MWKRLDQVLMRGFGTVWRRVRERGFLAVVLPRRAREQQENDRTKVRARFWADLREGQREAEARSAGHIR